MEFFNNKENVEEYIRMSEGYDGQTLVDELKNHLPQGASLLELGMGPGKDLDLLKKQYTAAGSDMSRVFLDRYRSDHPQADLLELDAVTLNTQRKFDGIYSNKVLHHLSRDQLVASFLRQEQILNPGGIVLHSFWEGVKEEFYEGMRFLYYHPHEIRKMISDGFEWIKSEIYTEFKERDSFYIVLKKA